MRFLFLYFLFLGIVTGSYSRKYEKMNIEKNSTRLEIDIPISNFQTNHYTARITFTLQSVLQFALMQTNINVTYNMFLICSVQI